MLPDRIAFTLWKSVQGSADNICHLNHRQVCLRSTITDLGDDVCQDLILLERPLLVENPSSDGVHGSLGLGQVRERHKNAQHCLLHHVLRVLGSASI
ncbi:hypothetical protein ADK60_37435 [Streptomyces sp. XY431]|nr:hypothetical protein ADK60_37435 [Streptomyces sp. XY431]